MANPEHLERLKAGVDSWNKWRLEYPPLDLSGADLSGVQLAGVDLRCTNVSNADLAGANLRDANLYGVLATDANLAGAALAGANLASSMLVGANLARANLARVKTANTSFGNADLTGADFTSASLVGANFTGANLTRADFSGADLVCAILKPAEIKGANFSGAKFGATVIDTCDLSLVSGLEEIRHTGPSTVGLITVLVTATTLAANSNGLDTIEAFLRDACVSVNLPALLQAVAVDPAVNSTEFSSCFVSYSHQDRKFAARIYEALQARGIRCWLDEHQLLPGDDIYDGVNSGIQKQNKVLLCCSKDSLTSWWIKDEIDKALGKERELQKDKDSKTSVIIPLDLDGYLLEGWQDGRASTIQRRLSADFKGWESNEAKFKAQFENVVKALQTTRDL